MKQKSDLPTRSKKALGLRVIKVSHGNYLVESGSTDHWYSVVVHELRDLHCGCPDFRYRGFVCKHIRAAALADAKQELIEI